MDRPRVNRKSLSLAGKTAEKLRLVRPGSQGSSADSSPSMRSSKALDTVQPSTSSSSGTSLRTRAAQPTSERDFEHVLSSGRTLVISPGPRDTMLPSDSDSMSDYYDHLEVGSDSSDVHTGIDNSMARSVRESSEVSGDGSVRQSLTRSGRARKAPAQSLPSSSEGTASRSSLSKGRVGSGSKRATPATGVSSLVQKTEASKARPFVPPVHPSSPENSIDTIMNNMPTPSGKQSWPPRSPVTPPRSPARSKAASSKSDSPKKTPPRPSVAEMSAGEPMPTLPVHPHQRTSLKSPRGEAPSLGEYDATSSTRRSPAIPSVHVPRGELGVAGDSGNPFKGKGVIVPTRTVSREASPSRSSFVAGPSTLPQASDSAMKVLSPRIAAIALDTSQVSSPRGSESSRDDSSPAARSSNGQQTPLRTRIKKTGNFLRRIGGNSESSSRDTDVVNTAATGYAKEIQLGSSATPEASVRSENAPANNQQAVASAKERHNDHQRTLSTSAVQKPSNHMEASASNATVNSLSSSGTSASIDYRQKLEAWERSVDDALEPANADLEQMVQIRVPSKNWTPSPRLPEYSLNRKGSFMDDVNGSGHHFASIGSGGSGSRTLSFSEGSDREPSTPRGPPHHPALSLSHGRGSDVSSSNASMPRRGRTADDHKQASTSSLGPEEKESLLTAQSYETANDRPSLFVRRSGASLSHYTDKRRAAHDTTTVSMPASNGSKGTVEHDSDTAADPEQSIRLVSARRSSSTVEDLSSKALPDPRALNAKAELAVQAQRGSPASNVSDVPAPPPKEEAWGAAGAILGQELATKCWTEDESFKRREKIAEWLGSDGQLNAAARQMYFDKFDFQSLSIEAALRKLCDKLFLRAETQQIDRILQSFSKRYFACNPKTPFASVDIIHAISFSILLLNTDLHVAEIDQRMTRQQFVRNTLDAILESGNVPEEVQDAASLLAADGTRQPTSQTVSKPVADRIEAALKDIYTAVKMERIRLPLPETGPAPASTRKPRTLTGSRVKAFKRGSIRGVQGLMGSSTFNSVEDDDDGAIADFRPESPLGVRPSFESSYGRSSLGLQGMNSFNTRDVSHMGFTGTLNNNSVKERPGEEDAGSLNSTVDDIDDDELALLGAPWAKEGMLTRKHYYESPQKRARDRAWAECFVVVQKGLLSMFKFGDSGSSSSTLKKQQGNAVGGGNWLSNATCIGQLPLAHALADVLPPPGYNRSRPHVFALTLASGNVFFFQAGHEELVLEWVSTCNYWAARLSREPLAAGVSNMEYGWNRVQPDVSDKSHDEGEIESEAQSTLGTQAGDDETAASHTGSHYFSSSHGHQKKNSDARSIRSGRSSRSGRLRSVTTSIMPSRRPSDRSSFDKIMSPGNSSYSDMTSPAPSLGSFNAATTPGSTLGRRAVERPHFVNEWRPPAPPTATSTLSEEEQLEACLRHTARIEAELTIHNSLRQPMIDLFKGGEVVQVSHGPGGTPNVLSPTASTISLPPNASAVSIRSRGTLGRFGANEGGGTRASRSAATATAALAAKAMANWERKSAYLLSELTKAQVYVESLRSASRLRAERRDKREIDRMMRKADENLSQLEMTKTTRK